MLFMAGACAGMISTATTYPFDIMRTQFTVQGKEKLYPSMRSFISSTYKSKGLQGGLKKCNLTTRSSFVDDFFNITRGLRQGGCLSPILWNIVLDPLITTLELKAKGYHCSEAPVFKLSIMGYADDVITVSGDRKDSQYQTTLCSKFWKEVNLRPNAKKSLHTFVSKKYRHSDTTWIMQGATQQEQQQRRR